MKSNTLPINTKVYIHGLNTCPMRKQNILHFEEYLTRNGYSVVKNPQDCDRMIVYTCAFRGDVAANSLDELDKLVATYSTVEICATGCLPAIIPDQLRRRFSGEIFSWKEQARGMERLFPRVSVHFEDIRPILAELPLCEDTALFRKKHPEANVTFHDQYIKLLISEGCPFECTYCTERLAFPPFKSFPLKDLVAQAVALRTRSPHGQFILIADCLGEYGKDCGSSLPRLIQSIRAEIKDAQFALGNFHPRHMLEFINEIIDFVKKGWIIHLNLPIQSANDRILTLMKRNYRKEDIAAIFNTLLSLSFTRFDTHLIVGFPGETDAEFQETIDFILHQQPAYVLLSKYYDTCGATATHLTSKVDDETVNRRMDTAITAFTDAGIIVNNEGSELMKDRLKRLALP